MSKKNNSPKRSIYNRSYLGRMTDEEYEALRKGDGETICQDTHKRYHVRYLYRLTDEEYRNLPYGNRGFHEQFNKK